MREIGAGISIWVNAMEVLARLGLAEAVRTAGREESEGIEATTAPAGGAKLTRLPAEALRKRFGLNVILTRPICSGFCWTR